VAVHVVDLKIAILFALQDSPYEIRWLSRHS